MSISNKDDRAGVKASVTTIMNLKGKNAPLAWQKRNDICDLIVAALKREGKFYSFCGQHLFVDSDTREIIPLAKCHKWFRLLYSFGVNPASEEANYVLASVLANADFKRTVVYNMSWWDEAQPALYINEYANNILKITPTGITRIRNGDDDVLMIDGETAGCEPLAADIEKAATIEHSLTDFSSSLIIKQLFDTVIYSKEGVGRENSLLILMTALIGLFFYERVPAYPFIYFHGPGGSIKTSAAVRVGKLLQGKTFQQTGADNLGPEELKVMATNMSFIVLDEANELKKLLDAMKVIATGGMDVRREYYTTLDIRKSPYQARVWMTANNVSLTHETISSRMMLMDIAARPEKKPYRSDYHVGKEFDRNGCWTELVGRLAAAMRELHAADLAGKSDLNIEDRMSAFFVFGQVLANDNGIGEKYEAAREAMRVRQNQQAAEGNPLVMLVRRLSPVHNMTLVGGKATGLRTAEEWSPILLQVVGFSDSALRNKVASVAWLRQMLNNNQHTLQGECGMVTLQDDKRSPKLYGFTGCRGLGAPSPVVEVMD